MKGHQPKIKKLSTAIRHGAKMCKERNIEQGKHDLFATNIYGQTCACALGMAMVAVLGVKEAIIEGEKGYGFLAQKFDTEKEISNQFTDILPEAKNKYFEENLAWVVYRMNDGYDMSPEDIANKLEAKGF